MWFYDGGGRMTEVVASWRWSDERGTYLYGSAPGLGRHQEPEEGHEEGGMIAR